LIERLRIGDERALEKLYTAYYPRLRGFAQSIVHSRETAEEVVHDVFVSLWERRGILDIRDVTTYLFRAVRLRAIDFARTFRAAEKADREAIAREILRAADALTSETEATDYSTLIHEMQDALETVVTTMPEARATAARLRWIDGLTIAEIADVMGISVHAAQKHISRAKAAVAAVVERFLDR
jgi:RNA polymerase sigma-70 factor (ECF subfamily)